MAESRPWMPSPDVRAVHTDDGLLLLDLRAGRYLALNPSAAALWSTLEGGASETDLAAALVDRFDVPARQAEADARNLLGDLAGRRLILPADGTANDLPPRTAPTAPAAGASPPGNREILQRPATAPRAGVLEVARAWRRLASIDLALRFGGLRTLYRHLDAAAKDSADRPQPPAEAIWRTHDAVLRAAALYFKRAWCLQRAVTETLMLRAGGTEADMVIGVCAAPFLAHAWVEIDGKALDERPQMLSMLSEIDRR